ncbi:MAG: acetyl-CoA carboxylase biotin carboxyl carrier protein [Firmicutes bacterium]|nr:acetyl-CoA carboxylase biotin carboxyl carrier protein [Bacillota bacterium]
MTLRREDKNSIPELPEAAVPPPVKEEGLVAVVAPLVGTFYQAPSPGAEPFVRPGSLVKPGDTLCILEAMKLMNEIEAEIQGRVVEIAVKDGELVEYGQVIMTLSPVES